MKPFTSHCGIVVPLLRANVDTDAIIPSREMTRVSRHGLGSGLFAGWRYRHEGGVRGEPNADFVLNQPRYAGASILVAGANFGCGSSREHAVWALADFGFRAILAPSFGSIFYGNCFRNGLLAIRLAAAELEAIVASTGEAPRDAPVCVDLAACTVTTAQGLAISFEVEPDYRQRLLEGLDEIDLVLREGARLDRFKAAYRRRLGWAALG